MNLHILHKEFSMRSSTFSSKPAAWFKTKVFSLFSLILFSFLLVGCGGADYNDPTEPSNSRSFKELTGFTFGSGVIKNAMIDANSVDIAIQYNSTDLLPIVVHTGDYYTPNATEINFANIQPATYRVFALDNSSKAYSVFVRRGFEVSTASELESAINYIDNAIAANPSTATYFTIFVANDITLSKTTNKDWGGKNIVFESATSSDVTIKDLIVTGVNGVGFVRVTLGQSTTTPCASPSICDDDDFNDIRNDLNGTHNLSNDIDLSNYTNWEPIGNSTHPFTGTLNGNNHTIRGLKFKTPNDATFIGLFGDVSGGKIRDLKVVADSTYPIYLTRDLGDYDNQYFGVLAGYIDNGANLSRITVSTSPDTTPFTIIKTGRANLHVGGIVGHSNGALIERSASSIVFNVTNNYNAIQAFITSVGGIAGFNFNAAKINNSYATGSISAHGYKSTYSGGIAGYNWGGIIGNSYASGAILAEGGGTALAGGIAGVNSGVISNSAALNPSATASHTTTTYIVKRIAFGESGGTFTNNFAISNIALSGQGSPHLDDANDADGAVKIPLLLQMDTTWSHTVASGGLNWDFINIWAWSGSRPLLR
jgi:hypothetical protein